MYYLYSLRMQGWWSKSATYTSDLADALQLSRTDAILFARRHKDSRGVGMIPVSKSDLEAL